MKSNIEKRLDLNLSNYPINLPKSLERVEKLLGKVGSPQDYLNNIIHIAGTNGKGSVLAYIKSCFVTKGFKINALTSPHLKDFRERIKINGTCISEDKVIEFINENSNPKEFFESLKHPDDRFSWIQEDYEEPGPGDAQRRGKRSSQTRGARSDH